MRRNDPEVRRHRLGVALDSIGEIEDGVDIFCLTYGEFSLIDALEAVLRQVEPAEIHASMWTATRHVEILGDMIDSGRVASHKIVTDRSIEGRGARYFPIITGRLGIENLRFIRTHAKFVLLGSDKMKVSIRTSMNLNENKRCETLDISTDPDAYAGLKSIVEAVFDEVPVGVMQSSMVKLFGIEEQREYRPVRGRRMRMEDFHEPRTTHTIRKPSR